MAITSSGIFSPDDPAPWDLTIDLAAMAQSIDVAIAKRANYFRGTSAERNNNISLPRGTMWHDTTNNYVYRKGDSAWQLWDGPEVTCATYISSYAADGNGNKPTVQMRGGVVHYNGGYNKTTSGSIGNGYGQVGVIPAGYRPSRRQRLAAVGTGGRTGTMEMSPDGRILLAFNTAGAMWANANGSWIPAGY